MSSDRVGIWNDTAANNRELGSRIRAAEYVRMSTDHRKCSTENQSEVIRRYAAQRGMDIVRNYLDAGRSELNIDQRPSLQQLLSDARSGSADFSIILVYDVNRWGRFRDSDEPADYEYACRDKGRHLSLDHLLNIRADASVVLKLLCAQ